MEEALYRVVVDYGTEYANDCGDMTEAQLFGYLSNRRLLGRTPEEVLDELGRNAGVMVEFENVAGKTSFVKISRVTAASA